MIAVNLDRAGRVGRGLGGGGCIDFALDILTQTITIPRRDDRFIAVEILAGTAPDQVHHRFGVRFRLFEVARLHQVLDESALPHEFVGVDPRPDDIPVEVRRAVRFGDDLADGGKGCRRLLAAVVDLTGLRGRSVRILRRDDEAVIVRNQIMSDERLVNTGRAFVVQVDLADIQPACPRSDQPAVVYLTGGGACILNNWRLAVSLKVVWSANDSTPTS